MKRFRFSLESVLTLRRFKKQEATGVLGAAQRKRQEAMTALEKRREELAAAENALESALAGSVKASRMVFLQNALVLRREEARASAQAAAEAMQEEERARDALLEAQREEEALEKLKERQRERALLEMEKEDEKAMEEFVAARQLLREES